MRYFIPLSLFVLLICQPQEAGSLQEGFYYRHTAGLQRRGLPPGLDPDAYIRFVEVGSDLFDVVIKLGPYEFQHPGTRLVCSAQGCFLEWRGGTLVKFEIHGPDLTVRNELDLEAPPALPEYRFLLQLDGTTYTHFVE
ncbi:MAG: hypothetical protein H7A21_09555 [Spirochaetales bacterium]|nr:hypothetical protein [Leptospiraceae bacterium]MCP5481667.1 hypothetical protein [Spirochaetales bacterium]